MTTTLNNTIIGYKIASCYKIGAKIGSGSFGEIHKGDYYIYNSVKNIQNTRKFRGRPNNAINLNRYRREIRRRGGNQA